MRALEDHKYISRFGRACKVCGLVRYWSEFARSDKDPTGFTDTCFECKHTHDNMWYAQKTVSK
jgi:hypothetical protein